MKDQFENLLAQDGLLNRFLYLVLFGVIFYVCKFILVALVIFQFFHLAITREKNEKVTGFAGDFSAYIGNVSAYLTLASDDKPFPFQDWGTTSEIESEETTAQETVPEAATAAEATAKPQKKATARKKTAKKKTTRKVAKKRTAKK